MDDDLVRWLLLGSAVLAILWVLAALWTLHVARRHGSSWAPLVCCCPIEW